MSNGTRTITVGDRHIQSTSDYSIFKTMDGNRNVNTNHVKELQRLLVDNGNLTNQFPIVVNKDMEVIDGQHRLEALKGLGWEVAYTVEDGATLNMVRAINLGNKNWNWRDMAESYAALGNDEYKWFLKYCDRHGFNYSIAMKFCGQNVDKRNSSDYYQGYLVIEHKTKAEEMAEHFKAAMQYVEEGMSPRDFGYALFKLRQSPFYNDERMLQKLQEKGHTLPTKASQNDYMRKIEEIFNDHFSPENKVRLF